MSPTPDFIEHPKTLVAAILACLPAAPTIARFFFGDFDSFKRGLWPDDSIGRWSRLLDSERMEQLFSWQVLGFVGAYAALTAAVYQFLVKLEHWLHLGAG